MDEYIENFDKYDTITIYDFQLGFRIREGQASVDKNIPQRGDTERHQNYGDEVD